MFSFPFSFPSYCHSVVHRVLSIVSGGCNESSLLMVFHRSLSDHKSPQVSRTLLSILTDFNNAVVWMISIRPVISKSSSAFNNPSVTVPRGLITISINVTFMFYRFLNSQARWRHLSFFFVLVLPDDHSLETEWQKISSWSLYSKKFFFCSPIPSSFQDLGDHFEHTNHNCYHSHDHVALLLWLLL